MHTVQHFFMIIANNHVSPPLEHNSYHFLPHTIVDLDQMCIRLVCEAFVDGENVNIPPLGLDLIGEGDAACSHGMTECCWL